MRATVELFEVDGRVLCRECMLREDTDTTVKRAREAFVCEECGARLRTICPHCGNLHIDPRRDIEAQARWCAEQERISIEAERIEFFDNWL